MGADSNGSQAKGGASGKGGPQADSNGARKKTSAPSVHDARKVSCPLILLGSVSARAPDFLHLNQASGPSDCRRWNQPPVAAEEARHARGKPALPRNRNHLRNKTPGQ